MITRLTITGLTLIEYTGNALIMFGLSWLAAGMEGPSIAFAALVLSCVAWGSAAVLRGLSSLFVLQVFLLCINSWGLVNSF